MFMLVERPPMLSEAALHGLRASRNTPVVNIAELPVGPARAAIVVYAEGFGQLRLSLALQSVASGRFVVFSFQREITETSPAKAIAPALEFGESMGFRFDDDLAATGAGRARGLQIWEELTGQSRSGTGTATSSAFGDDVLDLGHDPALIDTDSGLSERDLVLSERDLVLPETDLVLSGTDSGLSERDLVLSETDLVLIVGDEDIDPTPRKARARPQGPGDALAKRGARAARPEKGSADDLPKLRTGPKLSTKPDPGSSGSRLGRIPIVRRRFAGEPKPSLLCRLLASF